MPLLDHFRNPLLAQCPWEGLRRRWLNRIVEGLTRVLPQSDFRAYCARNGNEYDADCITPVVIEPADVVHPPLARIELPWRDRWDVRIVDTRPYGRVVGVVEIISEEVKRSNRERQTFAASCMIHLRQGASVVIVDGVTSEPSNLHNEVMRYCGVPSPKGMLPEDGCYVAAYRFHTDVHRMETWHYSVAIGQPIPTLPLCIDKQLFVPVELEPTYTEALADHNL